MCSDHGGPLANGDIEEMGGKVTVKCPWHAYHIAIETGEGLYMGMDMALDANGRSQPSPPKVKSKGVKQRTHFVEIRNGEDVFVADSSLIPGACAFRFVVGCQQSRALFCKRPGMYMCVADLLSVIANVFTGSAVIMSDLYAFRPMTIPEKVKGEVKIHSRFE